MKIEVTNGSIKWTVESTGNIRQEDFIAVITNSKISTMKFIELYYDYYTETKNAKRAYERVETIHEELLGSRKYSDYDTFRKCKSNFMNK